MVSEMSVKKSIASKYGSRIYVVITNLSRPSSEKVQSCHSKMIVFV